MKEKKKLFIWGTGYIEESFEMEYISKGFLSEIYSDVEGYIDTYKTGFYRGRKICRIEDIDKELSFIIVAIRDYRQIEKKLNDYGFLPGIDYICLSKKYNYDDIKALGYDSFNRIIGRFDVESLELSECCELNVGEGTRFGKGVRIIMSEFSKLVIGSNCLIDDDVSIICEKKSLCFIGNNSKVNSGTDIMCSRDSVADISAGCVLPTKLIVSGNSRFAMGEGTDFDENTVVRVLNGSIVNIGSDSMFSYNILIRGDDGHSILDLNNGAIIDRPKKVMIGDHVWTGMGAMILPGACVGNGSIIGAGTIVNKEYGSDVEIVGSPGRIVREHVSWDRRPPNLMKNG